MLAVILLVALNLFVWVGLPVLLIGYLYSSYGLLCTALFVWLVIGTIIAFLGD